MAEAKRLSIVVSEGTFDKAMMSVILANTAASMGMEVHVFYTFFGLKLLKKGANPKLPGIYRLFTGVFRKRMAKIGIEDFSNQLKMAIDLGVNVYACSTTMNLMQVKKEDMIDGVKVLGAAAFLNIAADSDIQLFIG
ncbi:MAG: DsrE/DsrF/DrsH-like family protein [Methanomassiliicoccales archaeon]|jgi:peroxiredoxin family protein|nr:DsrE/DsrF/DrsH-like family protein [Methanomassiliicoccales archaeon]